MEGGCMDSLIRVGDSTVKKKRSKISRGPRREHESLTIKRDEDTGFDSGSRKKELNLNQYLLNFSSANSEGTDLASKRIRHGDKIIRESDGITGNGGSKSIAEIGQSRQDLKCSNVSIARKGSCKVTGNFELHPQKVDTHLDTGRSGENRSLSYLNGAGNQNNIRKVKLKMGGVTRTIHTNSTSDGASIGGKNSSDSLGASQSRKNLNIQDTAEDNITKSATGLQGVPWKDFSGGNFSLTKESSEEKMPRNTVSGKKSDKSEQVRKRKRVAKRRALDEEVDLEDEEDDEIRYLEKLRNLKVDYGAKCQGAEETGNHQRRVSRTPRSKRIGREYDEDVGFSSMSGKDSKKSRSERGSEDTNYVEEEEPTSDDVPDARSNLEKESIDSPVEAYKELSLTRRQRALQSGKDASTSLIEYPDGLPPAPSRKNKEKPSEGDQQLKKAEAARRRKLQVENTNKKNEAEAIRKILGQDSSRKKKEDKDRKRRDELAQERAANARTLPPNTIRTNIGPNGTVVTFSEDVGLPSIFSSKPLRYPPPREKCAGPSCTNQYVYRDSKSNLPLCSLKCYKAIHEVNNT